jgi:hypothetical protein
MIKISIAIRLPNSQAAAWSKNSVRLARTVTALARLLWTASLYMSRVCRKSHGSVDFRQIPRFRHKKEPPGSPRSGGFGRSCCLNLGFCAGRQGCRGMGCRPAGLTESTNNYSSPTIQWPSERHTAAATALMDRSSPRFDRALRQLNLYIMVLLRERSRRTVGFIEPCLPSSEESGRSPGAFMSSYAPGDACP